LTKKATNYYAVGALQQTALLVYRCLLRALYLLPICFHYSLISSWAATWQKIILSV